MRSDKARRKKVCQRHTFDDGQLNHDVIFSDAQEEGALMTRALREAAALKEAAAYGPIPVRLHLPDNVIVQASFAATETLSALQGLVSNLVCAELSKPGSYYLYTTPPKQVCYLFQTVRGFHALLATQILRDMEATFFAAMLVPAAHVYLHINEGKGELL